MSIVEKKCYIKLDKFFPICLHASENVSCQSNGFYNFHYLYAYVYSTDALTTDKHWLRFYTSFYKWQDVETLNLHVHNLKRIIHNLNQ